MTQHIPLRLTPRETIWLLCLSLLFAAACGLPAIAQDPAYHHFADQGHWAGIAHPLDVLSNLPFALFGILGLVQITQIRALQAHGTTLTHPLRCAQMFCVGLIATTLGSSYYHLDPQDATLLWDRLGMAVAFVGILGLLVATQVSARAATWTLVMASLGAVAALASWHLYGNLLPWVVLQAGGLLLILGMGMLRPSAARMSKAPIPWVIMTLAYGVAKVFELQDHQVAELLNGAFTGHTIKHLLASAAALPVLWSLQSPAAWVDVLAKRQRSKGSVTINTTTKRHT